MTSAKTDKSARNRTDWDRLRSLPETEIERMADADEENPATVSDDEWSHATVGLVPRKISIHASFDSDVVDYFKRDGRGYQTRMNAVLRRYMEAQSKKASRA